MSSALAQAGYSYNKETLVWIRHEYAGIAYSDGDEVERRIASIIGHATDLGVLSDELRPHCTDWPSVYHLSGTRANILRPFEADLRGDILEIGAGCGAITRFLGECGGNVLALEGSPRRASIARARTRDLDNVTVVCDKFDAFDCDQKFDVITLIGVLEYANLFTSGEHPTLAMLERVRNFLKPSGKLIIAIENQLGLKYFAGAPEDHIGIPMYGIEGRYRNDQPQTFGRKELAGLIKQAGFISTEFLAPFPDYKLPVSIVTERGFSCDAFDAAALAWQSVCRDPQLPSNLAFSPELVWPTVVNNGLALDLANSFLIVASLADCEGLVPPNRLAWHYTTDRRTELCKRAEFLEIDAHKAEVRYQRLNQNADNPVVGSLLQHYLPERDEYRLGNVLSSEIIRAVTQDGWRIEEVSHCLHQWINFISKLAKEQKQTIDLSDPSSQLPGSFFDCIPQNIIISSDNSFHVIDKEWVANEKLELGYLTFRSVWAVLHTIKRFGRPEKESIKTRYDFILSVMNGLGWIITNEDIARWIEFEYKIQSEVAGRVIASVGALDWLKKTPLPTANLSQAVTERDGQIASLNQAVAERDGQIASLSQAVTEREAAFMSIINSRSWRLTKPYRWVGRMLRGDIAGAAAPFKKLLSMKKDGQSPAAAASADIVVPDPIAPTHTVSVILPVYRGIDMTRRCIEAAMPGVLGMKDAVLLAINDASPEQGMQAMLESLVEIWPGRFEVLENPVNLGFVGTVNRGMAHLLSQDVVLLNSDVIVPDDWLRRLQVEAYSHPRIATVTPFSNNATVNSFPNFLEENPLAFNLDVHTIDAVFRLSHLPCVSAPTGVGFCMYIRRACLDQIGYLNSEKFGRGYGEENDLCQRAIKAGWLNILSPNMYVFHEGGVSFSTDKQALVDRAMGVLDSLHPNYHADVQAFIQRDPLRLARVERYLQLLAKLTLPKVLHVSHGLGGGVRQHIEELAGYLDQGAAHLVLEPQDGPNVISLSLRACKQTDKLLFNMPDDYARLRSLLEQVGICAVHYHHTYNLHPVLLNLSRELHAITLLTAHDYFWLKANPTLTDVDGRFPGQYVDDLQNPLYPLPTGVTAAQWREKLRPLIEQADCVIFPSNATRVLFGEMYRFKHEVVAPHVEPYLDVRQAPRPLVVKQHYVVGVLGALGREKGADVLEKLATMALSERARFSFKLIGYSYRQLSAVETTGPYKVENLMALIEQHEVDLILFPAQWPETYSYTLSHALASGLPIIAPNLGAFPERLSGRACATLFDHMEPVSELYRRIGDFIGALESGTAVCAPVFPDDKSQPGFYDRDYLPLLESALKPPRCGKLSFGFDESQIVSGPLNKTGWRRAALRGLWWLNTHPTLRWVSSAVPYNFKRTVKRWLSRSPIHDSTI